MRAEHQLNICFDGWRHAHAPVGDLLALDLISRLVARLKFAYRLGDFGVERDFLGGEEREGLVGGGHGFS